MSAATCGEVGSDRCAPSGLRMLISMSERENEIVCWLRDELRRAGVKHCSNRLEPYAVKIKTG